MARGSIRAARATISGITSAVMGAFASTMSAPSASNSHGHAHGVFREQAKPTPSRSRDI